jgi:hypothetical protein
LISNLTVEAVVFEKPSMKIAPNGQEYLSTKLGMFNIRDNTKQEFTYLDCTLWSNPNLAKMIIEMDVEPRDRVLVNGKLNFKRINGRLKLRLYIYDFTLLSRATISTKNTEHEIENIDYSILNDNVEVFDTNPVMFKTNEDFKDEETFGSEEF